MRITLEIEWSEPVDEDHLAGALHGALEVAEEFWDDLVLVGTGIPGHPVSVQMVDAELTLDAPSMPKPHARLPGPAWPP